MKKLLKIIGITIGSIIGLVVVAAAVAVWCVFTPERVTPVVRSIADEYITCEWDMGDVELTFFSTFPEFGLKVDGLYLINPMAGAQSDTVLVAPSVVARLNVMEYLNHHNLVIREVSLPDMTANIFINPEGECNANVFYAAPDTTAKDSTAGLPFDSIVVNSCAIEARHLTFLDAKDSIWVALGKSELDLEMAYWDDIRLRSELNVESVKIKDEEYAHDAHLRLDIPAAIDLETMHIVLNEAEVALNEFELGVDGEVTIGDTIPMDVTIAAKDWEIKPLLALLPESIRTSLKDIDADGILTLQAKAIGQYSPTEMPLIDAWVQLKKGQGRYAALPYTFRQVQLDATAHIDMNVPQRSEVHIQGLQAKTLDSEVALKGTIKDVMQTMQTDAHLDLDVYIPDWKTFIPESMQIEGRAEGKLDVQATLQELMAEKLNSVTATGDVHIQDFTWQTDSMRAELGKANVTLNTQLKDWPVIEADVTLASGEMLRVEGDSLEATIQSPQVKAHAQLNIQDTTHMPTLKAMVRWDNLQGYFKDYSGQIGSSRMEAKVTNAGRQHALPVCHVNLSAHNVDAQAGKNHLSMVSVDTDIKAMYRKKADNFLLKWNPVMKFFLNGAEADLDGFPTHVSVPNIIFSYSNRDFDIMSSSIVLGNSDFSLSGNIHNIGKWIRKKEVLTGELNFVSNHTDVNELLEIFSANQGSEETVTTTTAKTDTAKSDPFLVPEDVDLTLNTHIKQAEVLNQVAHNLGGKVYIKDGTMVLEEMGFVCNAAKLQLTAMYRTPRRNHIYLGFDYHMLDVKIDQLISMIPQIDSMVPYLKSFKGDAEFHLAAETYLREDYSIKTSTLRGACSLFGKDLVVMDSETFDKIAKLLSFKKKTVNKVDSISAEITLYKDEVDVYPFCVSMDNYMAALGGKHHLDMSYDYHINLLSPVYIGVDVKGDGDNLSIKPAKCIYAKDFKPIIHHNVDTQNAELRQIIRESLRKNVKIQ